jgi:hypothetical protein
MRYGHVDEHEADVLVTDQRLCFGQYRGQVRSMLLLQKPWLAFSFPGDIVLLALGEISSIAGTGSNADGTFYRPKSPAPSALASRANATLSFGI